MTALDAFQLLGGDVYLQVWHVGQSTDVVAIGVGQHGVADVAGFEAQRLDLSHRGLALIENEADAFDQFKSQSLGRVLHVEQAHTRVDER
jgi:hypothetical protein